MNIACPTCTKTIHAPSRTCHWCGHDLDESVGAATRRAYGLDENGLLPTRSQESVREFLDRVLPVEPLDEQRRRLVG
jgi:hypothetical protein